MEKPLEKPVVREAPEAVPSRDVHVVASPTRCPYCHDDVAPERSDWVACKACLARHHVACWRENGACGTCRQTSSIAARGERTRSGALPLLAAIVAPFVFAAWMFGVGPFAKSSKTEDVKAPTPSYERVTGWYDLDVRAREAWDSLKVGDSFELEFDVFEEGINGRKISQTYVKQTIVAKAGETVTASVNDTERHMMEMRRDGHEFDRYRAEWVLRPEGEADLVETPAGSFACRHYRTNPDKGAGGPPHLLGPDDSVVIDRWFAGNLAVPVKSIETRLEVGTKTTILTRLRKTR